MKHPKTSIPLLLTLAAAMISFPSLGCTQIRQEEKPVEKVEAKSTGRVTGTGPHQSALGIEMVEIPAGRFAMGSPESEEGRYDNERQHEVVISRPFLAAKYEVTQGQWKSVMGGNPSSFDKCGDDCPVEEVSWYDAVEFCNRLSALEGLTLAYWISGKNVAWDRSVNGYRLPTEAEWEYACRAGIETRFNTGSSDSDLGRAGWYHGNSGHGTHPVGQKAPNGWGLYDMHGNVWERCWDRYGDYPRGRLADPDGPMSGSDRVLRGGCWGISTRGCRSARRCRSGPGHGHCDLGLRLFRSK